MKATTKRNKRRRDFYTMIDKERSWQNEKWGEQCLDLETWMLILGEEFGELQKAILEAKFEDRSIYAALVELVQVAAVCSSIYEQSEEIKKMENED